MQSFEVTYRLTVLEGESVNKKIDQLCLEQSVELPRSVLSNDIAAAIVGKPTGSRQISEEANEVTIEWPLEDIGKEITAFLNLLYGNISLKPGIQIENVNWEKLPESLFGGPAFGINKIRALLKIDARPLSATALKPLGCSAGELADRCYHFAKGGIDLIKDDHNLANQNYAPFEDRLEACVEAVQKAEDETGRRARYFPHITASGPLLHERFERAREAGADGVLVCPHICGLPLMHKLRTSDIRLPIIAHPAFSGSLVRHNGEGFRPAFLYGQLWRALGADFVIYANAGGRFSFTENQCWAINEAARSDSLPFHKSFPMPAGGLKRENITQWKNAYGPDTVFLMGGSLYEYPGGIEQAAREFSEMLR